MKRIAFSAITVLNAVAVLATLYISNYRTIRWLPLVVITVLYWGRYAMIQQHEKHPESSALRLLCVYVVNVVICPFAIFAASNKHVPIEYQETA